jgi:mannitol-1-phosphate 5-dehydrogenase
MSKRQLLIYGAGAIGRGFIPWVFTPDQYEYRYVESNKTLRELLQTRGNFSTHMTVDGVYKSQNISIDGCCPPGEEGAWLAEADAVVTAVGPRNFSGLRPILTGTRLPVICCENDASLPAQMRKWTGNQNIVFAIPDVITSSTASAELLAKDPLAIITENGETFIDSSLDPKLPGHCQYVNAHELAYQWLAKLYVHNTPHCIAAYLGSVIGVQYLHEAMDNPSVAAIVEGAMHEMVAMLKVRSDISHEFLAFYRGKELSRFRNHLLFDPITRVAREPFRKLEPKDRLIGAAQLCLAAGVIPTHILIGIMAAFYFDNVDDSDAHIRFLRRSMSPEEFLRTIIKLRDSEALFILLVERWEAITKQLKVLRNE